MGSDAKATLYRRGGKRVLDVTLVLLAAPLLLPLTLLTGLAALVATGRPVFFAQERPGLSGSAIRVLKFRTMTDARDSAGSPLPDAARLTAFGRLLRRSSLDELPELWSVLTGTMSLVGPRPLLTRYLERYDDRQRRRHEVRPGITGWAQVNGRNAIDWPEKLELDVWYVDNLTLWLDLRILARTLAIALTGRGVSARGEATMPEFKGNDGERP